MAVDLPALLAWLARATGAARVLEIGAGDATVSLAVADVLPAGSSLLTLERDQTRAAQARARAAAAGHAHTVSVIAADAARYLHKIAGPFDLVVQRADPLQRAALHERLVALLATRGILAVPAAPGAGGYNEMLTADHRLQTIALPIGAGLTLSVRRPL